MKTHDLCYPTVFPCNRHRGGKHLHHRMMVQPRSDLGGVAVIAWLSKMGKSELSCTASPLTEGGKAVLRKRTYVMQWWRGQLQGKYEMGKPQQKRCAHT